MCLNADHIFDFISDTLGIRTGQVDLVDHRKDIQIVVQRQIYIGKGLRLDTLCGIHHQDGAVTCRQAAAHFIIKVHMAGRIDQVEYIFVSILGIIDNAYCLRLDGNTALPLQFHIVKHLCLHLPAGQQPCLLYDPVRQRRFPVIYMGYNTKISDLTLVYGCHNSPPALTKHAIPSVAVPKCIPQVFRFKRIVYQITTKMSTFTFRHGDSVTGKPKG